MLAQRPPMGWNTWNTFAENISDELVRESADAFVDNGLLEAGYKYLVIDDCWSERDRDPATGKIVPSKTKFPNGMKAVSDYVHSKGLKFGMYTCAGVRTCADYPGSFDHEFLDAETFAEYGCDYLKYDFCYKPNFSDGPMLYRRIGMALKDCGREILFSACNWGHDDVHSWIRSAGAHIYRSTGDIIDNPESFKNIAMSQIGMLSASAPGCYNDMDMLTVGMYGNGHVGSTGCDDADYRTQFVLWCLFGSPLMLGCDIRNMNEQTKALVTNRELIAINQDEEARPPFIVSERGDKKVFFRHLSNGEYAVVFVNFSDKDGKIPFYVYNTGITATSGRALQLTDLFTGEDVGTFRDYYNPFVKVRDCKVYRAKVVRV